MVGRKDSDIFLRIELVGAEAVRELLKSLGATGQQSLDKISRAGPKTANALDRVDKGANKLTKSTKQLSTGQTKLQEQLRNTAAGLAVVQGPLGPLAGRFTAVGAAIGRVGPIVGLAIAGIAGLTAAFIGGAKAGAQEARGLKRIENQILATGFAAQKTVGQIRELSDVVAFDTFASREGARDAASVLLTFPTIQGDNFERVLRLSQDMAEIFGGDLRTQALRLGRVLEDPARNMGALGRSGVVLNETLRKQVKAMQEVGDKAGAIELILKTLEGRIGGAGVSDGLAGQADLLADKWNRLLSTFGETALVAESTAFVLKALEQGTDFLQGNLNAVIDLPLEVQAKRLEKAREALNKERAALEATFATETSAFATDGPGENAANTVVFRASSQSLAARELAQDKKEATLQSKTDQQSLKQRRLAQDARSAAIAEARAKLQSEIDELEVSVLTASATKADKIRKEFEGTLQDIRDTIKEFPQLTDLTIERRIIAEKKLDADLAALPPTSGEKFLQGLLEDESLSGLSPRQLAIEQGGRKAGPESEALGRIESAKKFDRDQGVRNDAVVKALEEELRLMKLTTEEREVETASRKVAGDSREDQADRADAANAQRAIIAQRQEDSDQKRLDALRLEIHQVGLSEEAIALEAAAQEFSNENKAEAIELTRQSFAAKAAEADSKLIDALIEEIELSKLNNEERQIAIALRGLSEKATDDEAKAFRALTVTLIENTKVRAAASKRASDAISLTKSLENPQERFNRLVSETSLLYQDWVQSSGEVGISLETQQRALAKLREELEKSDPAVQAKIRQDKFDADRIASLERALSLIGLSERALANEAAAFGVSNAAKSKTIDLSNQAVDANMRLSDTNLIETLQAEIDLARLSEREREIEIAMRGFSELAIDGQREALEKLINTELDEAAARQVMNRMIQQSEGLTKSLETPQERYNRQVQETVRLHELWQDTNGRVGISLDTMQRAMGALQLQLDRSNRDLANWQDAAFETTDILRGLALGTETWLSALERLAEFFADRFLFDPLADALDDLIAGAFSVDPTALVAQTTQATVVGQADVIGKGVGFGESLTGGSLDFGDVGEEAENVTTSLANLSSSVVPSVDALGEQLPTATFGSVAAEQIGALSTQANTLVTDQATTSEVSAIVQTNVALGSLATAATGAAAALSTVAATGGGSAGGGLLGAALSGVSGFAGGGSAGSTAFAAGGIVSGPGTDTSDSILARLSDGEAVLPADVVRKNPDLVESLIAGGSHRAVDDSEIPGFRFGGILEKNRPFSSIDSLVKNRRQGRFENNPESALTGALSAPAGSRVGGRSTERAGARARTQNDIRISGPFVVMEGGGSGDGFDGFAGEGETMAMLLDRMLPAIVAAVEARIR